MAVKNPKKQSSYAKKGKKPHKYSELYSQWRAARLKGDETEATRLGKLHTKKYLNTEYEEPGIDISL